VKVLSTIPLKSLTYQLLAQGKIIRSDVLTTRNLREYKFNIKALTIWTQKAYLYVFFITEDGEIISDEQEIEFEGDLKNFVSFLLKS